MGMIFTTTNKDITEEIQFRIPAIDILATRKLVRNFSVIGRVNAQILQNHISVGLKWTNPLSKRIFFSLSDEIAFWAGILKQKDLI